MRARRWGGTVALAALAVVALAAAAHVAVPRVRRELRLRELIRALDPAARVPCSAEVARGAPVEPAWRALLRAAYRFARVEVEGAYCQEELARPRFPEPAAFARAPRRPVALASGELAEAVAPIVSLTGRRFERLPDSDASGLGPIRGATPWLALVRLAPRAGRDLVVEGSVVKLVAALASWSDGGIEAVAGRLGKKCVVVPPAKIAPLEIGAIPGFDPEKTLRALAAAEGCVVRARTDATLEVVLEGKSTPGVR